MVVRLSGCAIRRFYDRVITWLIGRLSVCFSGRVIQVPCDRMIIQADDQRDVEPIVSSALRLSSSSAGELLGSANEDLISPSTEDL